MKLRWMLAAVALYTAPACAQSVVGELYSGDASVRGAIQLSMAGTRVLSGSQIAAGEATAKLKLERGGELRICPRTRLSLNETDGRSLVLGLNAGALELDYQLAAGTDVVLTPDFRLQLIGPGSFRLAVSVAASGDTCMRTMRGDDASIFITETMGNQAYQLAPGKSVLFRGGKLAETADAPAACGCPELSTPPPAAQPAAPAPTPLQSVAELPPATAPAAPPRQPASASSEAPGSGAAEPARAAAGDEHLEVHNAFIMHGDKADDSIYSAVAHLLISRDSTRLAMALLPQVQPPPEAPPVARKKPSFAQRLGSFFSRIFHK